MKAGVVCRKLDFQFDLVQRRPAQREQRGLNLAGKARKAPLHLCWGYKGGSFDRTTVACRLLCIAQFDTLQEVKKAISFRLTEESIRILKELAKANGLSQASQLELMIRQSAKRQSK